jgi:hypothetical protein
MATTYSVRHPAASQNPRRTLARVAVMAIVTVLIVGTLGQLRIGSGQTAESTPSMTTTNEVVVDAPQLMGRPY